MRRYYIEHSVIKHKAIRNSTFVAECLGETFGNILRLHFCDTLLQRSLDKADQEHLPHADERLVQIYKPILVEELLDVLNLTVPESSLALLSADHDQVILLDIVGKDRSGISFVCLLLLLAHVPSDSEYSKILSYDVI